MNTITVDTYPEQESYFAALAQSMKAQREIAARQSYTAAYSAYREMIGIAGDCMNQDSMVAAIIAKYGKAGECAVKSLNAKPAYRDRLAYRASLHRYYPQRYISAA